MLTPFLIALTLPLQTQELKPLERMAKAFEGHRSVECRLRIVSFGQHIEGRLRLLTPNVAAIEAASVKMLTDGKEGWLVLGSGKVWSKQTPDFILKQLRWLPGFGTLLGGTLATASGDATPEKLEGEEVIAIPVASPSEAPVDVRTAVLLSPTTWLPRAVRMRRISRSAETGKDVEQETQFIQFEEIRFDGGLTPADFRYVPPADFHKDGEPAKVTPEKEPVVSTSVVAGIPLRYWSASGPSALRVPAAARAEGGKWVVDVQVRTPKGIEWKSAGFSMYSQGRWVPATLIRLKDGKTATVGITRTKYGKPDGLRVSVPKKVNATFLW